MTRAAVDKWWSVHLWCSFNVGFVVDKYRVRGFSRGAPVSSHFLHSTNLSHRKPKLTKGLKLNYIKFKHDIVLK